MTSNSSRLSLIFGLLGVVGFSITLPATRLAITDLDPTFVGLGRALVAACLAGTALLVTRATLPRGRQWWRLGATAAGIVLGFPLLSAWAMTKVPAAHGAVVVGLIPLVTALFAVVLTTERPRPLFWIATVTGSLVITAFSLWSGHGVFQLADLLLVVAVLAAGYGYAEGARLSRELGAWQTISWSLVVSAPVVLAPVLLTAPHEISTIGWRSLVGFAYVSIISMFLAFIVWYKGLALGGIARVGQLQLLQPFFTMVAAALILSESISRSELLAAVVVVACVLVGRRAATQSPTSRTRSV